MRGFGKLLTGVGVIWVIGALWWWNHQLHDYYLARQQHPEIKLDKLTAKFIEQQRNTVYDLMSFGAVGSSEDIARNELEAIDKLQRLLPIVEKKRKADRWRNIHLGLSIPLTAAGQLFLLWPKSANRRAVIARDSHEPGKCTSCLSELGEDPELESTDGQ